MKKLLLVAAVAAFTAVNAQMEKGSWVVGATSNLGFNSAKTTYKWGSETEDGGTVNTFTFSPSFGYFIQDNLALGLDLGFVSASTKEDGDKMSQNTFSIMPTATYYFYNEGNVIPYLGAGLGYASVTSKYNSTSETFDGFAWKGKGGIVFLLNKNVGVDLGLSYNQFSTKENFMGEDLTTRVGTLGVNAGFTIFLNGKKSKNTDTNK